MISFRKLFDLLESQGKKKYWLGKRIGHHLVRCMENGQNVTVSTINKACTALNCQPGDIMEFIPEELDTK